MSDEDPGIRGPVQPGYGRPGEPDPADITEHLEKCERCGSLVCFVPNPYYPLMGAARECWERIGRVIPAGLAAITPGGNVFIVHTPERCTAARLLR